WRDRPLTARGVPATRSVIWLDPTHVVGSTVLLAGGSAASRAHRAVYVRPAECRLAMKVVDLHPASSSLVGGSPVRVTASRAGSRLVTLGEAPGIGADPVSAFVEDVSPAGMLR